LLFVAFPFSLCLTGLFSRLLLVRDRSLAIHGVLFSLCVRLLLINTLQLINLLYLGEKHFHNSLQTKVPVDSFVDVYAVQYVFEATVM